jgi:ssDNA-binding Zn-finger/Zn-ribbon topoisomerase 1
MGIFDFLRGGKDSAPQMSSSSAKTQFNAGYLLITCPLCGGDVKMERTNGDLEMYFSLIDNGSSISVQPQTCPNCRQKSRLEDWYAASKRKHGSIWA